MRTVGLVDSARDLMPDGHVWWTYQDRTEFRARAREYLVDGIALDQKMSVLPVAALWAYDLNELGHAAAAEMACLHPRASVGATPFHLYAEQDVEFALAGELELEFLGHRRLLVLVEQAWRANGTVVLRTARPGIGRIIELLDLEDVRVEPLT